MRNFYVCPLCTVAKDADHMVTYVCHGRDSDHFFRHSMCSRCWQRCRSSCPMCRGVPTEVVGLASLYREASEKDLAESLKVHAENLAIMRLKPWFRRCLTFRRRSLPPPVSSSDDDPNDLTLAFSSEEDEISSMQSSSSRSASPPPPAQHRPFTARSQTTERLADFMPLLQTGLSRMPPHTVAPFLLQLTREFRSRHHQQPTAPRVDFGFGNDI